MPNVGNEKEQAMNEVSGAAIASALLAGLRNVAAVIIAIAVVGKFGAPFVYPFAREQIAEILGPITAQIDNMSLEVNTLTGSVDRISSRLDSQPSPPFLSVLGVGLLPSVGPFHPGDLLKVVYMVQRNQTCRSNLEVRFLDESGAVVSNLTYVTQATRAPITSQPQAFPAAVRLPLDMPSGRYAYAPIIDPDRTDCPNAASVTPLPSEYFTVEDQL